MVLLQSKRVENPYKKQAISCPIFKKNKNRKNDPNNDILTGVPFPVRQGKLIGAQSVRLICPGCRMNPAPVSQVAWTNTKPGEIECAILALLSRFSKKNGLAGSPTSHENKGTR